MHANDEFVRPSTEKEATSQKVEDRRGLFTPYLVFYKRILQCTEREE